jgi:hypothetical protein
MSSRFNAIFFFFFSTGISLLLARVTIPQLHAMGNRDSRALLCCTCDHVLYDSSTVVAIERISQLSALEFERRYRMVRPVVVEGGASHLPACTKWTMPYLRERAGAAEVQAFYYRGGRGDYDASEPEATTLAAFIAALIDRADPSYLFPSPSAVFARNDHHPERHVGWAARANPGLAALADDFALPGFVRHDDYVLASLILGSAKNATDLHYDLGGESKLLIQIAGRKRIRLVPPSAAPQLALHSAFAVPDDGTGRRRNRSRGAADPGSQALADHSYETVLAPGDVIYWPAFWSHEIANLDTPTFATSVFLDEVRLDPLIVRHLLIHTFQSFLRMMQGQLSGRPLSAAEQTELEVGFRGLPFVGLLDLFEDLESFMLSPGCAGMRSLWTWNWMLPAAEER